MRNQFGNNLYRTELETLKGAFHAVVWGQSLALELDDLVEMRSWLTSAFEHAQGNDAIVIRALQGMTDLDLLYLTREIVAETIREYGVDNSDYLERIDLQIELEAQAM